jgi:DNA-binding CsgD family transcriptional regulator
MTPAEHRSKRVRGAIVAADDDERHAFRSALERIPEVDVVAWADSVAALLALGTRVDLCLCDTDPSDEHAARLRQQGVAVVVHDRDVDPAAAVRAAVSAGPQADVRRPKLSSRQHDVLTAYAASNDLLPTVARRLGMDPETVKTHLRRIRAKYAAVGRPAPTRRDLYVRAVEDGFLPPPSGRS